MKELTESQKAELDGYIKGAAKILYENTEVEKLKSFESIEWEVREQILTYVAPEIGNFFYQEGKRKKKDDKGKSQVV
jgi:hypothetical protein